MKGNPREYKIANFFALLTTSSKCTKHASARMTQKSHINRLSWQYFGDILLEL